LSRKGITKQGYESGSQSVTAARGHANTPEHPKDALRHPGKYESYLDKIKKQRKRDRTLLSAAERAQKYYDSPENRRQKPYWPDDEETAFWNEYRSLQGLPVSHK
jgi:hypothetical protein